MGEIKLPTKKSGITRSAPKLFVIFSKPKVGKTTAVSLLENNLLIDLEHGADFVDALKVNANNITELFEYVKLLEKEKKPYRFITLDTATALEDDIVGELAIRLYKATPMGKNYDGDDLRKLPNGAGYLYLREAFKLVIDKFATLCDTLILTAHCNEKMIDKDGKEMYELEMDLTGKLKRIIASKADAIGYMYRKGNQTFINFNGGGDTIIEARSPHLANKEFLLVEKNDKGQLINYWNQIFID
jgi:hypothetical protein